MMTPDLTCLGITDPAGVKSADLTHFTLNGRICGVLTVKRHKAAPMHYGCAALTDSFPEHDALLADWLQSLTPRPALAYLPSMHDRIGIAEGHMNPTLYRYDDLHMMGPAAAAHDCWLQLGHADLFMIGRARARTIMQRFSTAWLLAAQLGTALNDDAQIYSPTRPKFSRRVYALAPADLTNSPSPMTAGGDDQGKTDDAG